MRLPLAYVVRALVLACVMALAAPVRAEEATPAPPPEVAPSTAPHQPAPVPEPAAEVTPAQPATTPAEEQQPPAAAEGMPEVQPPAPLPQVEVPQQVPPPIVDVEVAGYGRVAKDEILAVVQSKTGGPYEEAQVKRDVEAIRNLGSFQRVWQESVAAENGVKLIFHVIENPVITDIQFEGNRELTREQLLKVMKTQPGQIYNARVLLEDAGLGGRIERLYQSQGYTLAMVLPPSMSDTGVLTIPIASSRTSRSRATPTRRPTPSGATSGRESARPTTTRRSPATSCD